MSIEVTWEIVSIDDVTGDITVKFTNGTKQNLVNYKWEGDKQQLVERLNKDALSYTHMWMCSPVPSGIKTELFQLTGTVSSNDVINLDNNLFTELKPQVI